MMKKILIEVVTTNDCNRRCSYCDLDFRKNKIKISDLDKLILFIKNNHKEVEYFIINFFWWEPLLSFDSITYFVEQTKNISNVKYSIGTNGILLDDNKLLFFKKNDFDIYLSIDTEIWNLILNNTLLFDYLKNIQINFLINPNTIEDSFLLFDRVLKFWYKRINVMPVFSTINRDIWSLKKLKKIIEYIDTKSSDILISKCSYFNGISSDIQFVLDTNGKMYRDIDTLLWIQKQYTSTSSILKNEIEFQTWIWSLTEINTMDDLLSNYDYKKLIKLVLTIPKEQWILEKYKIISSLLSTNNKYDK